MTNLTTSSTSVCTLCGKVRIVSKTWIEKVEIYNGFAELTRTLTVCPDPDCQSLVDKDLKKQKQTRDDFKKEAEMRLRQRRRT